MTASEVGRAETRAEGLLALAAHAGQLVVALADAGAWETVGGRCARLLGCADAEQTRLAEQWLDETRTQLAGVTTADTGRIRAALAERWAGW